jgi:hypothetical protein
VYILTIADSVGSCQVYLSYSKELDVIDAKSIRVFSIVELWLFVRISVGIRLAPLDAAAARWKYATIPLASCLSKAIGRFVFCFSEQSRLEL